MSGETVDTKTLVAECLSMKWRGMRQSQDFGECWVVVLHAYGLTESDVDTAALSAAAAAWDADDTDLGMGYVMVLRDRVAELDERNAELARELAAAREHLAGLECVAAGHESEYPRGRASLLESEWDGATDQVLWSLSDTDRELAQDADEAITHAMDMGDGMEFRPSSVTVVDARWVDPAALMPWVSAVIEGVEEANHE